MITKNDLLGVLKAGIAPAQGCKIGRASCRERV